MSSGWSAEFDAERMLRAIKNFPKVLEIEQRTRLKNFGARFERRFSDTFTAALQGPFKKNTTKDKLANRTGNLARSLDVYRVTFAKGGKRGGPVNLKIGASVGDAATRDYVFTQEYGATIRPKKGKYLTIPMPDNLTPTGRSRYPSARALGDSLRVAKIKGKLYLIRNKQGGGIEILWILKKSVKVPARLGFQEKWSSKEVRDDRARSLRAGYRKALERVGLK